MSARNEPELIGMLVHELEAPLLSLEARLRALSCEPPCREEAQRCLSEVLGLRELVAGLVSMARDVVEHVSFPLAPVVERLDARFRPLADARGVELDLADTSSSATGDARATEQILSNLLDNAIKYTAKGTSVTLRVIARPTGRLSVEVTDDGPGLTAKELECVFTPFYRADREAPGFGLGLAIAKHFANLQRGELYAELVVGRGARFVLSLEA